MAVDSSDATLGDRIVQLSAEADKARNKTALYVGYFAAGACVAILAGVNTDFNDLSVAGEALTGVSAGVSLKGIAVAVRSGLEAITLGHRQAAMEVAQAQLNSVPTLSE